MTQHNSYSITTLGFAKVVELFTRKIKKFGRSKAMWRWLDLEIWDMDINQLSVYHAFATPFPKLSQEEWETANSEFQRATAQEEIEQAKIKKEEKEPEEKTTTYFDLTGDREDPVDEDTRMF